MCTADRYSAYTHKCGKHAKTNNSSRHFAQITSTHPSHRFYVRLYHAHLLIDAALKHTWTALLWWNAVRVVQQYPQPAPPPQAPEECNTSDASQAAFSHAHLCVPSLCLTPYTAVTAVVVAVIHIPPPHTAPVSFLLQAYGNTRGRRPKE